MIVVQRHDELDHRVRDAQFEFRRLAFRIRTLQGHLEIRAGGIDVRTDDMLASRRIAQVRLDRIAERFQRLREQEYGVAFGVGHRGFRVG